MSPWNLQVLAWEQTGLGLLCLRGRCSGNQKRSWRRSHQNHEFLMSSYNTNSERGLARFALDSPEGHALRVSGASATRLTKSSSREASGSR